jgi:hypothetical protein
VPEIPPETPALTMTEIVKWRYQTGEYGGAHFLLARDVWDQIRAMAPPVESAPPWRPPTPMAGLLGIPIRLDDSVPVNEWQLVDNDTAEVLHRGVITEQPRRAD